MQISKNLDGSIIRSWNGSTTHIHQGWDGTKTDGTLASSGQYSVSVSAQSGTTTIGPSKKRMPLVGSDPQMLVLVSHVSPGNGEADFEASLNTSLTKMKNNNPGFDYAIFDSSQDCSDIDQKIQKWMKTSLIDFCFTPGHGYSPDGTPGTHDYIPRYFVWGGTFFYAETPVKNSDLEKQLKYNPDTLIAVPSLTNNRQYIFVFIDACLSSGGNATTGQTGSADYVWSRAFNIGTDPNYASTFLGWNGYCITNNLANLSHSQWYDWRVKFWDNLSDGVSSVQQAYDNTPAASTNYMDNSDPKVNRTAATNDQGRHVFDGDPYNTILPNQ